MTFPGAPSPADGALVSKAMVEAWVKAAGKNDRLVYFAGGSLPPKSKIGAFAATLREAGLVTTHNPRGADGALHYMIIRTAQPLPKSPMTKGKGA